MDNKTIVSPVPVAPVAPVSNEQQQSPTNDSSKTAYDQLDDLHKYVAEMRARWIPYSVIVKGIKERGFPDKVENTLRQWCMEGGSCYDAIQELKAHNAKEQEQWFSEIEEYKQNAAKRAWVALSEGVEGSFTAQQIAAAESILDRTGFPKTSKVEGKQELESSSMNELAQALRLIAEGKK